jgi:16S rRNA (adenine1518-N6/adenine1519-N6)-dimethyltransferase
VATKRRGQNFLHDANLCRWIAAQVSPPPDNKVWEIGPGLGALTDALLERGWNVSAIELDRGFCEFLREQYAATPAFHLMEGDALHHPRLFSDGQIAANLPYAITTPLAMELLRLEKPPRECVWTVQREAAERLMAAPRTGEYGAASAAIQLVFRIELLRRLPPTVFYPQPEVDSAIVRLTRLPSLPSLDERLAVMQLLRIGFAQRRKKLAGTLTSSSGKPHSRGAWEEALVALGANPGARPEELSPAQWLALAAFAG